MGFKVNNVMVQDGIGVYNKGTKSMLLERGKNGDWEKETKNSKVEITLLLP